MDFNSSSANLSCHPDVEGYRYFGALLGVLVTAVGSAGNVMTLLAFATEPRLRSRFNALILNLSVADLVYCGFLQPITVDTYIHFRWRQGPVACRLFGLVLFVANAVSIFSLILVALSRYLLIADAHRFHRVFSRLAMPFFLALPWLLGLALFGPLWDIYVFLPPVCTCSFHRSRGRPYTTILMFLMFVAGLSSIGLFYFLIHRRVRAARRALEGYRLQGRGPGRTPRGAAGGQGKGRLAELSAQDSGIAESQSVDSLATEASTAGPAETPSRGGGTLEEEKEEGTPPRPPAHTEKKTGDQERSGGAPAGCQAEAPQGGSRGGSGAEFKRVTRMCFAMFLVYVTCYLPFCLLHVADRHKRAPVLLHMVAGNFTWLNSCLNPILYAAMNRQFRDAYRGVLSKAASLARGCLGRR